MKSAPIHPEKFFFCKLQKTFIVLLIQLFVLPAFSQTYPIQISTQLIPPYSGYLPDYADPSSEKLKIILQFNDFTKPQYHLKLRIEIKGNGFTLITKQLFIPPPITIQPGIPLLISGADLAPYLNSNNLDFIGINQSQYEQRMALPEGYYSICVKAYDYYNPGSIQVSNESCSNAWFTLSNPPLLNLPLCGKAVTPLSPQNIIFQWTPVNCGSPNSATNTDYEFALWEIRPDSSANPNTVAMSTAPIFSTTTSLPLFNYGLTEPPLNLYYKYAWRVRAVDLSGRDWFKNSGYSQVCTFVYGNLSNVLGNSISLSLSAQGVTHRLGKCTWNSQSIYSNYQLQVRKQGTNNWFDYYTTSTSEKVSNLEPNTDYEARVRGEGSSITGDWSNTASFRTLGEPVYGCGDVNQPADPLAAVPLPANKAIPGLIIASGQFEVKVTQISSNGGAGWYNGKGYAFVFGFPIAVQFSNIFIDDNNRHQQGTIQALTQGITAWTHQWDVQYAEENANYVNGTIDSIYVNGPNLCVSFQGSRPDTCFSYPTNQNVVVVRDGEGNQYTVQLIPPPPKVTGPSNYLQNSNDNLDAGDSCMVVFEPNANQNFGFDKKQYVAWTNNYELIKLKNNKNYFVPYKSVGENQSDKVNAAITIIPFDANKLSFKTANGQTCAHTPTGNNLYEVTVPDHAGSVYAWYNGKKAGKLNVISLKAITKKLVIVPVNNASINSQTINNQNLNNIFKQANINWTTTVKSSFTFTLGTNGLEAADATLMSKYSNGMRALRDAYRNYDSLYDKEAYYVFVVNNFSDPNLKGYMVRGRALGFLRADATAKDLAHELAHGAFGLEHTFPAIPKSSSNNLMDYKQGVELGKVQWSIIHLNKPDLNWFDNEEEGALLDDRKYVLETINLIKTAYNKDVNIKKSELPLPANAVRIENAILSGITYAFIQMEISSQLTSIHPNGHLVKTSYTNMWGTNMPCIEVDSKLRIYVPQNRIDNLEIFIKSTAGRNLLLFVNGYILEQDLQKSPDVVYQSDVMGYWSGIDADFINAIRTKNTIYANGNDFISTSNHKSHAKFITSLTSVLSLSPKLNTEPNPEGFNERKTNGAKAGRDLVSKLQNGTILCRKSISNNQIKINDTLDVVCHSMGFAYAQGIIEECKKAGIHLGRYYIIAPENACTGYINTQEWEEVWQYGSDEQNDLIWKQDGVAPQCPVSGLTTYNRVKIPEEVTQNFIDSHLIKNYKWIFNIQNIAGPNGKGYVKKR